MDSPKHFAFITCEVKCPGCDTVWTSSLDYEQFKCMTCGATVEPKKHVVVEDEKEIN